MLLTPGARLGPYEVTAQIGVGGMGEVYRATDTNLKRAVAIKVLPASVASDVDRLARFQREAEVLASLNHPNIAAIHGLERSGGITALVMELVEGPTLADRIAEGAIPIDEALPIAKQIAEALETAHEQGIIHRDLKPANIKLRPDGTVKVLDFGLAKALVPDAASASAGNLSQSPTITSPAATRMGVIMGTAAYMSPEQARGRPVDKRSDIWAFGCVLYEMLTGTRAFDGEDITETIAAVVKTTPHWSALPANVPAAIVTLIHRCLEKDRNARVGDLAVARFLLAEDALVGATPMAAARVASQPVSRWRSTAPWVLGALVIGGLAGFLRWRAEPVPAGRPSRFVITTLPDAPMEGGNSPGVTISPDGSRLVYRTNRGPLGTSAVMYMRTVDQLAPVPLRGADGVAGPAFSPDGTWIVYGDDRANALKRIATGGGPAVTICSLDGSQLRGVSWGPDGTIVFATARSRGLLRVPAAGGTPTRLTTVDSGKGEADHFWPDVLPDGRAVLFTAWDGSLQRSRIAMALLPDGQVTSLLDGTTPRFVSTGHVVFAAADRTLRVVGFDSRRLQLVGTPVPAIERVGISPVGAARFAVSTTALVYSTDMTNVVRTLVWVDRKGQEEAIKVPPRAYTYARLSPDGGRVALDVRDEENDIWIWDLARQTLQRLTNDPGMNRQPVWTPDGQRVAFSAVRDGVESVHWQAFDGSGTMERLSTGTVSQSPRAFSPDGTRLIFGTPTGSGPYDLGVITLGATHTAAMLLHSAADENSGDISPDGRWLAYESNESGRSEIYVRPFPNVETGRRLVSTSGGTRPLWSRNGRELFYYVAPDTIMALPVRVGADVELGAPQVAVKGPYAIPVTSGRHYDVSADGQRFLLLKEAPMPNGEKAAAPEIHLVLNWFEELKRLVPVN